ncbi:acid phosphatase [Edaphobacter aggregans]|uniref:acid phosphatase n=1 Tax=Edaphobacter aggregans TaxID=570835 RepID=UPI00068EBE48|nr:phosphatase PAP2 family protein [Edaphobacter aggregans]
MRHLVGVTGALGLVCFAHVAACAQGLKTDVGAKPPKAKHEPYFIHPDRLPLMTMIPAPPAEDSVTTKAEFAELHRIQEARTPEQVKAAQDDDAEEDIFVYRTVLGPSFNAQSLPLTAALSAHVHGDEPVASNGLKERFARQRPYQVDATLHPVCKVTTQHNAYPSGHTVSGYMLALTLAKMVPEKSAEILERADNYAHNRLVCGVHTSSDLEASRRIAYVVFGSMTEEPRFQRELAAAQAETRKALGLNP